MSKKKNIKDEELKNENIVEEKSLDEVEPDLEEKEGYRKASFGEKLSLKFRKKLIASRLHTLILIVFLIVLVWGINIWADSKNLAQIDVTKNHLYSLTRNIKRSTKELK